jgi:predicted permease
MWWQKLKHLLPGYRRQAERDMQEELEALRVMAEPSDRAGLSLAAENARDVWRWSWLENTFKDVRYALRQLRQAPAFTILSIATLTIGIGAAAALAGLLNDAFFATLPVRNPEQVRQLEWSVRGTPSFARRGNPFFSYAAFEYVRSRTTSFSNMLCWSNPISIDFGLDGYIEQVSAQFVSYDFFRTLGVTTALGRPFSAEDDVPGAPAVVILGQGAWQRLFGGDPDVLGRTIQVNGTSFVVIGVGATEFHNTPSARWSADLTLPVSQFPVLGERRGNDGGSSCRIMGRLKAGFSETQAQFENQSLIQQAFLISAPTLPNGSKYDPQMPAYVGFRGLRGIDQMESSGLWGTLSPLVAVVLLIGAALSITSANIAGMLLARGISRRREIATRLAIGGGRGRIVRQLLTESLLLAGTAGALGIFISYEIFRVIAWNFTLDLKVIAVIAAVACFTGIVCGLAPSLTATKLDLTAVMKQSSPSPSTFRTGKILIGIQVSLSFLLLVATGLLTESFRRLLVPTDFEPEHVITTQAHLRNAAYTQEQVHQYFEQTMKRLDTLPGVTSAAVSSGNALFNKVALESGVEKPTIVDYVSPRFFETMRIKILLGRDIQWSDRKGAANVVVVNEAFARSVYPDTDPLGKMVRMHVPYEIVGVVANSNNSAGDAFGWGQAAEPALYVPFSQQDGVWGTMTVSVRVNVDLISLMPAVRRVLTEVDPKVTIDRLDAQSNKVNFRLREMRLTVAGLALFALVGLLQASVGVYGTLSYFVNRRTFEIGLRVAMGAGRYDVVRMVIGQSLTPVGIGVAVGLTCTPLLTRLMEKNGLLIGHIAVFDQVTIVSVVAGLFLSALLAAFTPAWRASRLAPMEALRHD